ncbi:hypothetical protein BJV82DRAFT_586984, partial [Fennellomyces sp. T-0311]
MHSITLASLLLTLSTTSFSYAAAVFPTYINETAATRSHHQLWERQDLDISIVCPLNVRGQSPLADIFNHFGFISYGDTTMRGDYPFPVAVKGALSTLRTDNININHPGTCAVNDTSDVYSYGLDNPGTTNLGKASVYGNVLLNNTSAANVVPAGENCDLYSTDRSVVDYEKVRTGLRAATRYLASLAPDLTVDSTGLVNIIAEPVNPHFRVFTVNTCYPPASDSTTCSSWSLSQLSTANLFSDRVIWNGPTNSEVLEEAETIVTNVPVLQSRSLFIFYTDPSLGFKNCRTIFNFYAVDESGEFVESDTSFSLYIYSSKSSIDESSTSTDESSTSETSGCTSGTTTETVTTETTTTEASTTTTDYTTTTTTEDTTVASTTVTVTQSATSAVFTTATSTFTTTYTSDHSTITAVVTTTAPVLVPVENSWDDEREIDDVVTGKIENTVIGTIGNMVAEKIGGMVTGKTTPSI